MKSSYLKLLDENIYYKMRYTFADRLFPKNILLDIENLVYEFAYNKTKVQLHNELMKYLIFDNY